MAKKKIALVLGGGGARGIAHLGVIKALEEEGVKPDFIVGASMGAIVGAVYGLGWKASGMIDFAHSFKAGQIARLFKVRPPKGALVNPEKAFAFLNRKIIKDARFSDLVIPLKAIATSLDSGLEVIMQEGDILTALMASSAVPGIFPPVSVNNDYLVDGGVLNPTPVDAALRLGAEAVIAVDLVAKEFSGFDKPNIVRTLMQTYEIMRSETVRLRVPKEDKRVVLIEPLMRNLFDSYKFHKLNDFLQSGYTAACKKMPEIKAILAP